MGVAPEHMDQAGPCEVKHAFAGCRVGEEVGGGLDEDALADQPSEALVEILAEMSLRVSDEDIEPTSLKLLDGLLERVIKRPGGRLEQDPPAGSAEAEGGQLIIAELVDDAHGDLAAGKDSCRATAGAQGSVELGSPGWELIGVDGVIGANMRRRTHGRDPVGLGLAGHRHRVVEITSAVVEAGEDVAVEVDHRLSALHDSATRTSGFIRLR
jgi:hypothetical protein